MYNKPPRRRRHKFIVMKTLKMILLGLILCPLVCSAQNLNKQAKKEAKAFEKDGWEITPGALPLQVQFLNAYEMQTEKDDLGYPKFIIGEAMSIGENYDAAKMQALELAKLNLAGAIETELVTLVDNSVSNKQLSSEEAASITETVTANKNLISQNIGRVVTIAECYRTLKNKNKEVYVRIAYNAEMAKEAAKKAIRKDLEQKGTELQQKLDELLAR